MKITKLKKTHVAGPEPTRHTQAWFLKQGATVVCPQLG